MDEQVTYSFEHELNQHEATKNRFSDVLLDRCIQRKMRLKGLIDVSDVFVSSRLESAEEGEFDETKMEIFDNDAAGFDVEEAKHEDDVEAIRQLENQLIDLFRGADSTDSGNYVKCLCGEFSSLVFIINPACLSRT